jgi:hypothetical protein
MGGKLNSLLSDSDYDLNEIESFEIVRRDRAYSDIFEIKKIAPNSFEIEIDESNYNIYIFYIPS